MVRKQKEPITAAKQIPRLLIHPRKPPYITAIEGGVVQGTIDRASRTRRIESSVPGSVPYFTYGAVKPTSKPMIILPSLTIPMADLCSILAVEYSKLDEENAPNCFGVLRPSDGLAYLDMDSYMIQPYSVEVLEQIDCASDAVDELPDYSTRENFSLQAYPLMWLLLEGGSAGLREKAQEEFSRLDAPGPNTYAVLDRIMNPHQSDAQCLWLVQPYMDQSRKDSDVKELLFLI